MRDLSNLRDDVASVTSRLRRSYITIASPVVRARVQELVGIGEMYCEFLDNAQNVGIDDRLNSMLESVRRFPDLGQEMIEAIQAEDHR